MGTTGPAAWWILMSQREYWVKHIGGKKKEKRSLDFIAQINVRMKQVWHHFSSLLPKVNQRETVIEARNTVLLGCGWNTGSRTNLVHHLNAAWNFRLGLVALQFSLGLFTWPFSTGKQSCRLPSLGWRCVCCCAVGPNLSLIHPFLSPVHLMWEVRVLHCHQQVSTMVLHSASPCFPSWAQASPALVSSLGACLSRAQQRQLDALLWCWLAWR